MPVQVIGISKGGLPADDTFVFSDKEANGSTSSAGVHLADWDANYGTGIGSSSDSDEPGLAGVTIYADVNFNGTLDDDVPVSPSTVFDGEIFV